VNSVAYSPDGKTLASGSSDDTIKLWDVTTGNQADK
jgi:WD40 repeat protein